MAAPGDGFLDLYAHGFVRVGVAVPRLRLADPAYNLEEISSLYRQGAADGMALVSFPELSLSGYSLDDLHQQETLLQAVLAALQQLADVTVPSSSMLVVGAPLRFDGRLYNCACVLSRGRLLGIVPKSYLPDYREFYEKRQFAGARDALSGAVECLGQEVPFGADLVFRDRDRPDLGVHVEICEDVWVPIPPSTYGAFRGATILVNLSASNITIGKSRYRHDLAAGQSAKTLSAYLYAAAGAGESSTDLAWDGEAFVYEDGELLAASQRFDEDSQLIAADVDLDRLVQERSRVGSFSDCATDHRSRCEAMRVIPFSYEPAGEGTRLRRTIERYPYVPGDPAARDERCYEAYNIQVSALVQRLRATGIERVVIGVSGGLDSTHALIVCARAMDRLGFPRSNILGYSMPGFATSERTRRNAHRLMGALAVSASEIDIRPSCLQMFRDIEHPFASGEKVYDVTFENVQAGERTSHLFRLANQHGALVVGTGDLSELALGWCTYGVGDQMSHYGVNVSVPKTLVRHLIEWEAERADVGLEAAAVLHEIVATEISPELVPGDDAEQPAQRTEETIGPFDLHDFSLYHFLRRGYGVGKVVFLCAQAWANDLPGAASDSPYSTEDILRWQRVFLRRFFQTSQFKRSAIPNGPKVGSGGSLSPRGDWRAPSDSAATVWLAELDAVTEWVRRDLE